MHITDIINKDRPTFSFEFFPPKSERASESLLETIKDLESLDPSYVSITYGAGGTTRERTHDLVENILETTSLTPIPHLTCVQHTEEEISNILKRYSDKGVSNILALRGDTPKGETQYNRSNDSFYFARDLVEFISAFNTSTLGEESKSFGIG